MLAPQFQHASRYPPSRRFGIRRLLYVREQKVDCAHKAPRVILSQLIFATMYIFAVYVFSAPELLGALLRAHDRSLDHVKASTITVSRSALEK
jgi:hypothetical protein